MIVATVTIEMNHWIPVNLSFIGRMGTIVVFLPGRKVIKSNSQMRMITMMQTGRATKNQTPHPGGGDMFCKAMRFWGDAIGEAEPPMFAESAMPRSKAFVMSLSAGRLRRIGWTENQHNSTRYSDIRSHLNDAKTKHWCRNIADPHAGEHRHAHVRQ